MKGTGKPKELLHKTTGGILNFFSEAVNSGKGVVRTSANSIAGRKITSAKGSIFVGNELLIRSIVLHQRENLPKPGCGTKEVARRLKQQQRILAR